MKNSYLVLLTITFYIDFAYPFPIINDPNFIVEKMMDRIDGQIPRLEAIRNQQYGSGVIAASINNGIMTVLKIPAPFAIEEIGTKTGFPVPSNVKEIRFDKNSVFDGALYISVGRNAYEISGKAADSTEILRIGQDQVIMSVAEYGGSTNRTAFFFDFSDGSSGYSIGAYMHDTDGREGTKLCFLDTNFTITSLVENCIPLNDDRTEMDVWGMEFDPTGLYGHYLTMVDSDDNDSKSAIYQLLPDLTWVMTNQ